LIHVAAIAPDSATIEQAMTPRWRPTLLRPNF
jgi:hypothetical protein